jgi:anti-sigma factor RsiW
MTGEDDAVLVHAYVDGELDPANARAIEQRLASDPALAAERSRVEALRRALKAAFPLEPAPVGLRARIERAVGLGRVAARPTWTALAASVALAGMLGAGSGWYALSPRGPAIEDAIVSDHIRGLMAPQPVDVASSDRHTVKPWFNGRIPESPRVIDLAGQDFPLLGGRIDVIGEKPVPTLVYGRRKHVISLTAVPAPGRPDSPPASRDVDGYHVIEWTAMGVAYWAVSDVSEGDLAHFVTLFRTAPPDQ